MTYPFLKLKTSQDRILQGELEQTLKEKEKEEKPKKWSKLLKRFVKDERTSDKSNNSG